jgi:hypothetical protein
LPREKQKPRGMGIQPGLPFRRCRTSVHSAVCAQFHYTSVARRYFCLINATSRPGFGQILSKTPSIMAKSSFLIGRPSGRPKFIKLILAFRWLTSKVSPRFSAVWNFPRQGIPLTNKAALLI